jgi:HEAT repeat protein
MDLHHLKDTPSWEWPDSAAKQLLATLRDEDAAEADRCLAAELAGDLVVMNDDLAAALINILEDDRQPPEIRGRAAISLGPVLEQVDTDGFDGIEDPPISKTTSDRIQKSLHRIYLDAKAPKEVRRRALEASVRAPQTWHGGAIRSALASDDQAWTLTAVFCMGFVKGFDAQILEALNSMDSDIHCEAVVAAGNWGIKAAWPHIANLIASESTEKPLLLAAIEAVPTIRPDDASAILGDLLDSDDEDIVDAVEEALAMARGLSEEEDWDREDDEE